MHQIHLDTLGTPDSKEWRHHGYTIRLNGYPCNPSEKYLVWDRDDQLIGEAPSLREAQQLVDEYRTAGQRPVAAS